MGEIKVRKVDLVLMLLGFSTFVGNLYIFRTVNEWSKVQHLVPSGDAIPVLLISGFLGSVGVIMFFWAILCVWDHNYFE